MLFNVLEYSTLAYHISTLSLEMPVASRNDQREGNDENVVPEDQENNKSKEIRLVWFKPTDRRTPLIAIPIHLAPSKFITKPDQYKNQLFTVSALSMSSSYLTVLSKKNVGKNYQMAYRRPISLWTDITISGDCWGYGSRNRRYSCGLQHQERAF